MHFELQSHPVVNSQDVMYGKRGNLDFFFSYMEMSVCDLHVCNNKDSNTYLYVLCS